MRLMNIVFFLICFSVQIYSSEEKPVSFGSFDFESGETEPQKYKSAIPSSTKSITKIIKKRELGQRQSFSALKKELSELRRAVFPYPFEYDKNKELYDKYYNTILTEYFLKYTHINNLNENIIKANKLPISVSRKSENVEDTDYEIEIFEDIAHNKTIKILKPEIIARGDELIQNNIKLMKNIIKPYTNLKRILSRSAAWGLYDPELIQKNIIYQNSDDGEILLHRASILDKADFKNINESSIDPNIQNWNGDTPLHRAIRSTPTQALFTLLKFKNIDLNVKNANKYTPLMTEMIYIDDLDDTNEFTILNMLLEAGATDMNGALLSAAKKNAIKIIKLLFQHNFLEYNDINFKDESGDTALHLTTNPEIVTFLLEQGAKLNIQNNIGQTPLIIACQKNNISIVSKLLKKNANPDIAPILQSGYNALMYAILMDYDQIVNLLLQYNADPNFKSEYGETPLLVAVENNNFEMVKLLLEYDADPDISDNNNYTPLYYALKNKHFKIARLLFSHSKDKNKIIGLFLLALTSIGAAGFFGFRYYKSKKAK